MSADGARKLFVGGLADTVTEDALRTVFEGAGFQVEHLALPRDRETGRLRGFAFITLDTEESASRARSQLQGVDCAGRPLSIREFSQEPPKRGAPGERPKREEEPTVFLGKLPFEASAKEIEDLFDAQGAGPVARLTLPMGPDGRPRGFGFATLGSPEQVQTAVAKVNGATLRGRQIVVSPAQPRGAGGGAGPGRGPGGPGGPGGDSGSRRPPSRYSDRPSGPPGGGGFDNYDSPQEPPTFPPPDGGKGGAMRTRREGKKEKREKRRGGAAGATDSAAPRGERKRRGGGGNWHRWESDDD